MNLSYGFVSKGLGFLSREVLVAFPDGFDGLPKIPESSVRSGLAVLEQAVPEILQQPVAEFQYGNSLLPFFKIRIDRINFAFT